MVKRALIGAHRRPAVRLAGTAGSEEAVRRASLGLGCLFPRPDDPAGVAVKGRPPSPRRKPEHAGNNA